ncbi:MipA/OmpV family protein [Marimonas sp. MJW-29]|uniref:MipA/OmpV family protein n=1 Tax=Sulfitobacter sediminis TaxID=3234186 RepID=A0ABV3RPG9_9RHOB
MRTPTVLALAFTTALAATLPATAQERSLNFSLRGGVAAVPSYPGADDYEAAPDIGFTFGALKWGGRSYGNGIGNIPDNGLAFRGAFKFIGERDDDDYPELAGLEDIDPAVELGFGLIYRETNWQAFGEVRRGFGGHEGVTGTLGADLIFRPTDRWTITAGPRVNLGNTEYASTYFGVSAAEAAASSFGAFEADGGVLGAGFEVEGIYRLNDLWAVESTLSYERLQNSAADSPITQAGSEDQWRISIGLSRAFTLNF